MRLACIPLTVLVTLGVGSTFGQSADEAAINKRVEGLFTAVAKGDVKALVASYDENAVRAIGTSIAVGRSAIEKAAAETFRQGGIPIKFTRHAMRLLSPTTAIVHGGTENASTNPPTKGHSALTLVKQGNDWLVAALQTAP